MKRRDFLRSTGWFVVGASLVGTTGCTDDTTDPDFPDPPVPAAGTFRFPQGVASGDPHATSVVLWTRVTLADEKASFGAVKVRVQVSNDTSFSTTVVDHALLAAAGTDHTVRVLVTGLAANATYYYRFTAGQDAINGRTRTAPAPDADVQVNFAWVSCQDYSAGHYGVYRQMLVDDDARPEADKIHAVIHLGDMIYETRADGFQGAIDDNYQPIMLLNRDGKERAIAAFPSGGGTRVGVNFAQSVDDYRHLYRTFLSDPDLQAARARWPFVCVWDDHEFTDDNWQSQANYDRTRSAEEGDQVRKLAASQAWFEYIPAHLTGAEGVAGVASHARDFSPELVNNAPFTAPNAANFVDEPNNVAAVGAITIYRSLRFGQHVELVMTDERSYRSDHAIPEELTIGPFAALFFAPRNALPLDLVNELDKGNSASPPRAAIPLPGLPPEAAFPNARVFSPPGTMLGARQKQWWKDTMKKSNATWKLWGNEVMVMRMRIQRLGATDIGDRMVSGDAWDGYPTERNELMSFLRSESIKNVVVLSGDIHASFAGVVMDNYDAATQNAVAYELVAAGVSSNSLFSFFEAATRPPAPANLRGLITVDAGVDARFVENFNLLLTQGTQSAGTYAATKNLAAALSQGVADPNTNAHLKYCDTNSQGYGFLKVNGTQVAATIVTINRPIAVPAATGAGIKRSAAFTIPKDNPAGTVGPIVTGTKPFPLT
jgi:alkaline phosphatase D